MTGISTIYYNGKDYEILQTNLQPFFWRKVKNIIRQNKKSALQEFLFGNEGTRMGEESDNNSHNKASNLGIQLLEDQIQNLHNQVDSLQQKVIQLEAKFMTFEQNSKYALSEPLQPLESSKTIQQGNSTMEGKKTPYLIENQSQIRNPTYQTKDIESKSVSDAPKIDFKDSDTTQQYNDVSNQNKTLNQQNFITLSNLSEDDKIKIIKTGFQLQAEEKISLKKYYESIRRTSIYKSLKE